MKDIDTEKLEQDIVSALMEAGSWRKDNIQRERKAVEDVRLEDSGRRRCGTRDETQ